jgi:hypothetical protein
VLWRGFVNMEKIFFSIEGSGELFDSGPVSL